jgi:transposase InsO family protein
LGIPIRALLTDNGHCYRSHLFHQACAELGLRHRFTRPYTPRTNGKAERFIQTALREWIYAFLYANSELRNARLPSWLHHYNWHRPHGSLNHAPPISRSGLGEDNLLRLHSYPNATSSLIPVQNRYSKIRVQANSAVGNWIGLADVTLFGSTLF